MAFGISAGTYLAAGAAVAGGAMAANASNNAAEVQENAARDANNTQIGHFNMTRSDQMPFIQNGTAGNSRLAYLLGINANPGLPGGSAGPDRQDILNQYEQYRLSLRDANGRQTEVPYSRLDAADRAAFDAEVDRRYRAAQQASQAEQMQKLQQAQSSTPTDPAFGSLLRKFTLDDLNNDPIYQSGLKFSLDEANKGVERQAAASGSLLSGATLKALQDRGIDIMNTKAGDSYNRFNNDKQQTFNMLSGISGTGQIAQGQVASAGQNMANNVSQNQLALGDSRAASAIGSNNALVGAMNGLYGMGKNNGWWGGNSTTSAPATNPDGSYNYGANGWWDLNSVKGNN